jgi:hypothetical protein
MFSMNMRSVVKPSIQTLRHACAGTLWTLEFDHRGVARAAFCGTRAQGRGTTPFRGTSTLVRTLETQLQDWRQRKFPRWVWVNPRADAYVEGARDLGALTTRVVSTLASRGIGALIHTRGGMPAGDGLVLVGRRFPGLLRVDLEFFSSRFDVTRRWERGASSMDARLDLLRRLRTSGVEVGVRLGPIIPSVNDDPSDWTPLLHRLSELGICDVTPTWLTPSRRLMTQIRREVSDESARRVESIIQSSDDTLYAQWRVATMNMLRHRAKPLGIEVTRCHCGPDVVRSSACVVGPSEVVKERQLALFG